MKRLFKGKAYCLTGFVIRYYCGRPNHVNFRQVCTFTFWTLLSLTGHRTFGVPYQYF
ncbi:MAG: hypothetical protein LBK06_07690 [Planctomycetaceae bacterium]|nr:hypothetical protein [Planctomycetaceae bacterium]